MIDGDLFLAIEVLDPGFRTWHTEWITISGRRPMKYYLWFKQTNGCDYTVSCGETLVEIEGVDSLRKAADTAPDILRADGLNDPMEVEFIRVLEVSDATTIDRAQLKSFWDNQNRIIERQRRLYEDEAELERLKTKLGRK